MQPRLQKGRYLYEVELVARGYTALGQGWRRRLLVLPAGQVARAGRRGDRVMERRAFITLLGGCGRLATGGSKGICSACR